MLALALGAALLGAGAQGQDCSDLPSQAAMNECADHAYRRSNAAVSAAYREIVARLAKDEAGLARLEAAQRAWIAFRDAECAFATAAASDGSVRPYLQATCLDDLAQTRLGQLQDYLDCQEGDLSCPVPPP